MSGADLTLPSEFNYLVVIVALCKEVTWCARSWYNRRMLCFGGMCSSTSPAVMVLFTELTNMFVTPTSALLLSLTVRFRVFRTGMRRLLE